MGHLTSAALTEIADLHDERAAITRDRWIARAMYVSIPTWLLVSFRAVLGGSTNKAMWYAVVFVSVVILAAGIWREWESTKGLRKLTTRIRLLEAGDVHQ